MVVQNNLLNLNTNRQSVGIDKAQTAPKGKSEAAAAAEKPEEESVSIDFSDASKKMNEAQPNKLDRTLPKEDERITEDEAAQTVDTARSNILRDPAQSIQAQANQNQAGVTSLIQ